MTRATINWLANISCYGYYITLDPIDRVDLLVKLRGIFLGPPDVRQL